MVMLLNIIGVLSVYNRSTIHRIKLDLMADLRVLIRYQDGTVELAPPHLIPDNIRFESSNEVIITVDIPHYNELVVADALGCNEVVLTAGIQLINSCTDLTEIEERIVKRHPILVILASYRELIECSYDWRISELEVWFQLNREAMLNIKNYHIALIIYLVDGRTNTRNSNRTLTINHADRSLTIHRDIDLNPIIPRLARLVRILIDNNFDTGLLYPVAGSLILLSGSMSDLADYRDRSRFLNSLIPHLHSSIHKYNVYVELGAIYHRLLSSNVVEAIRFITSHSWLIPRLGLSILSTTIILAPINVPDILSLMRLNPHRFNLQDILDIFIAENYTDIEPAYRTEWRGDRICIRRVLSGLEDGINRNTILSKIYSRPVDPIYSHYLAYNAIKYGNASVLEFVANKVESLRITINWKIINRLSYPIIEQFIPLLNRYGNIYVTISLTRHIGTRQLDELIAFPYNSWIFERLEFFTACCLINVAAIANRLDYIFPLLDPIQAPVIAQSLTRQNYENLVSQFPHLPTQLVRSYSVKLFLSVTKDNSRDRLPLVNSIISQDNLDDFLRIIHYIERTDMILSIGLQVEQIPPNSIIREVTRRMRYGEYAPTLRLYLLPSTELDVIESYEYLPELIKCIAYSRERIMDIALQCGPLWSLIAPRIPIEYLTELLESSGDHQVDFLAALRYARIRLLHNTR